MRTPALFRKKVDLHVRPAHSSVRLFLGVLVVTVFVTILLAGSPRAADFKAAEREWCGTTAIEAAHMASRRAMDPNACISEGPCDDPATRDTYAPGGGNSYVIQLYIHVFRNDDGSNAAASATDVINQMNQLNSDFAPSGIQFQYQWRFVNSSLYRDLLDAEEFGMKSLYAIKPDSFLNVYVLSLASVGLLGYAYTPWQSNALQASGGCVVTDIQNGGFGAGAKTLTHEIGHNLGLHHTQRGVSEVTVCGGCYESPGLGDNDLRGDFCSDTRPTPTNFNCSDPAGSSSCNGQAWAPTPFRNYMGYANDACYTNFTTQQMSRMRCWVTAELLSWTRGVSFTQALNFGPAPLSVDFDGQTSQSVISWDWDFGDGNSSALQSPTHLYAVGGSYDVNLTIQTSGGPFTTTTTNAVWAYADTTELPTLVGAPSQKIRVDISAVNKVPLQSMTLPFIWNGPVPLFLDSIRRTGLRTSGMVLDTIFDQIGAQRRAVFSLTSSGTDLAPGDGPVLSFFFRLPGITFPGTTNFLCDTLSFWNLQFSTSRGNYVPTKVQGSVTMNCCTGTRGNVDGSLDEAPDIADLTELVDNLFISFGPYTCIAEANCDGDPLGSVDIADLTALVDHLFGSLLPLPSCS